MITGYRLVDGHLQTIDAADEVIATADWIDLLAPSRDEAANIAKTLQIDLPTRDDMEEIEFSSRLYMEGQAAFMTATVLAQTEEDDNRVAKPISFILTAEKLITIRYSSPRPFANFVGHCEKDATGLRDSATLLTGLLDAIVDRLADILEMVGREVEDIGADVFTEKKQTNRRRAERYQQALISIGQKAAISSNVRESLTSLQRLFTFLATVRLQGIDHNGLKSRAKTLTRDASSLSEHVAFLSSKITFLLDATLGLISLEQNNTMKVFSVVAVMFLPPTLIASTYGMNFNNMPELSNPWGYPIVLGVMALVTVVPFVLFKRKGWL